jgi:hypothetical protein
VAYFKEFGFLKLIHNICILIFSNILNHKTLKTVRFANDYLKFKNYFGAIPRDEVGVTPWFTYPAISMLRNVIDSNTKVLEYGSGFSSLYFKDVVSELVSVEHNQKWAAKLHLLEPTLDIRVCGEDLNDNENSSRTEIIDFKKCNFDLPLGNSHRQNLEYGLVNMSFTNYALEIAKYPIGYFDVVVIDGMARSLCGYLASLFVAHEGLIILDNSDRWQYNSLQQHLINKGFGRIDFWGPGPINTFGWCTSFFSRNINIPASKHVRDTGSGDIGW